MKCSIIRGLGFVGLLAVAPMLAALDRVCPETIADFPALPFHPEQTDITSGALTFAQTIDLGRKLFTAVVNACDGQGRPTTTGNQMARAPVTEPFARLGGPDSNSCAGCHVLPMVGGAGGFEANVFHGAQMIEPLTTSLSEDISSFRNTPVTFGAGAIDQLAREMTADLKRAARRLPDGWNVIRSKGVSFEVLVASRVVVDSIGIGPDLIVRPFGVAGETATLREFSRDAFNNHHGMQAEEIFDLDPARGPDFDGDGVARELTVGDITAITDFQVALPVPGRVAPADAGERARAERGEALFASVGCATCHVPKMTLRSRIFDDRTGHAFDMVANGQTPRLQPSGARGAVVPLYSDLKVHDLCDPVEQAGAIRHFCNERHATETRRDQLDWTKTLRPGSEFFVTARLWVAGNTAPYGHRGDLPSLYEAILAHGGEARAVRDAYVALPLTDREDVIRFLKTLRAPEQPGSLLVGGVAQ